MNLWRTWTGPTCSSARLARQGRRRAVRVAVPSAAGSGRCGDLVSPRVLIRCVIVDKDRRGWRHGPCRREVWPNRTSLSAGEF